MANAVKEKFVADLTEDMKDSEYVLVSEYQGMSAGEFDELRASLSKLGAKYKVVKNRLAKLSLEKIGCPELQEFMKGPSALTYLGADSAGVAKALFKFSEQHTHLKVKAGRIFGTIADGKTLREMASLPSRNVLLATLLARMIGPLQSLVTTLNEPLRSLQAVLTAIAKQKETAPANGSRDSSALAHNREDTSAPAKGSGDSSAA